MLPGFGMDTLTPGRARALVSTRLSLAGLVSQAPGLPLSHEMKVVICWEWQLPKTSS